MASVAVKNAIVATKEKEHDAIKGVMLSGLLQTRIRVDQNGMSSSRSREKLPPPPPRLDDEDEDGAP